MVAPAGKTARDGTDERVRAWRGLLLALATLAALLPAPARADGLGILGAQTATAQQMASWYAASGHSPAPGALGALSLLELAEIYLEEGAAEGVRGDVAFAQSVLETAWFTFPSYGQVRAGDFNYGGIGAVDGGHTPNRFESPQIGVRAQVQHLRAYADPKAVVDALAHPVVDPRFDLVDPKGSAPRWDDLGSGLWASDRRYGEKVLALWGELEATPGVVGESGSSAAGSEPRAADVVVGRIAGDDRYDTAARAALRAAVGREVEAVYLANAGGGPDVLAAAAAAAREAAVLLLVDADRLPVVTQAALGELSPRRLVAVGREDRVSEAVVAAAAAAVGEPPLVIRRAGADAAGTAAALAAPVVTAQVVYLASDAGEADALAAGPAAARDGAPLLLTSPDALPEVTAAVLRRLEARRLVVLGGEAAVSEGVAAAAAAAAGVGEVQRLAGPDRLATAAAVARTFASAEVVYVASAATALDALAGTPAAALDHAPVLLTAPDALSAAAAAELQRLAPASVALLGGSVAVSDDVAAAIESVLYR